MRSSRVDAERERAECVWALRRSLQIEKFVKMWWHQQSANCYWPKLSVGHVQTVWNYKNTHTHPDCHRSARNDCLRGFFFFSPISPCSPMPFLLLLPLLRLLHPPHHHQQQHNSYPHPPLSLCLLLACLYCRRQAAGYVQASKRQRRKGEAKSGFNDIKHGFYAQSEASIMIDPRQSTLYLDTNGMVCHWVYWVINIRCSYFSFFPPPGSFTVSNHLSGRSRLRGLIG